MICSGVAPIARAASMRPLSTSRIAFSTSRAMKGTAASVSGTIAAVVPIEVPRDHPRERNDCDNEDDERHRARGVDHQPSALLIHGRDSNSPRCEVARNTPKGRPRSVPSKVETATM